MAVKMRLQKQGRTHLPVYKIVVADSRAARNGRYVEQVGTYDPAKGIASAVVNKEVAIKWLKDGVQVSDTVRAILKAKGYIEEAKSGK